MRHFRIAKVIGLAVGLLIVVTMLTAGAAWADSQPNAPAASVSSVSSDCTGDFVCEADGWAESQSRTLVAAVSSAYGCSNPDWMTPRNHPTKSGCDTTLFRAFTQSASALSASGECNNADWTTARYHPMKSGCDAALFASAPGLTKVATASPTIMLADVPGSAKLN